MLLGLKKTIFLLLIKGCLANKPVLNPSLSEFAKASSVVPVLLHSSLKILKSLELINDLLNL